jgi:adenine-specific DNA-methyltransferase
MANVTAIEKLITNFSNQHLKDFFFNKIHSFEPDADLFYNILEEGSNFEDPEKIGHAELEDSNELLIFTCAYKGELTQRSAKKRQFEIAKRVLREDFKDGAIFVFYDESGNFRLSFIRRYYGQDQKYSNWRRFTYYVQPNKLNKTFEKQLNACDFSSLDAIENAFNVEALSKEFYTELSHWYFASLNEVEFPNEFNENPRQLNSQAMIRLITRMMFVWFMKQKGLIPDEIFDKKHLDDVLKYEDQTGSTYYKAILQNLFFATLNTEMGEKRKWVTSKAYGVQHFYRYQRFFTESGARQFLDAMQKIPFLNGGLFENLDIVEVENKEKDLPKIDIRIDCFSDNAKHENRLKVPDYLFFGTREADISSFLDDESKSKVKIEGLIDLLNRYDFTIDENSPDDQEVALDPELLGTVFENLLASYNPETQSTARKESGSFYTPRPIVDYMVKESLFYYLQDKSDIEDEKLRLLLEGDKADQLEEREKRALVQHLTHIKILDPACGSGAFPMGALQQMVRILNLLDPENKLYKEELQEKLKQELQFAIDKSNFDELKSNIEEVFANQYNDPDYARKLFLIQSCLYGVDIQSIAM